MTQFILLYVDGAGARRRDFSEEEMRALVAEYIAWGERLETDGRMLGGARLSDIWTDRGRLVSGFGDQFLAVDGPYAETHEVVGGYAVIEAVDYDEAVSLCRDHPQLRHGRIIIRQLA